MIRPRSLGAGLAGFAALSRAPRLAPMGADWPPSDTVTIPRKFAPEVAEAGRLSRRSSALRVTYCATADAVTVIRTTAWIAVLRSWLAAFMERSLRDTRVRRGTRGSEASV